MAVTFFAIAAFHAWIVAADKLWRSGISGLAYFGVGMVFLRKWFGFRRGDWLIQWDGSHVQILDRGKIEYEGDLNGMHRIEQDGRGYFLYTTNETVFRLRRGRSSIEFEAALDRTEEQNRVPGSS